MKKLLVLALVLSMATMASAALTLQLSVNGDKEPLDSMIVVTEVPSGILTLDIWTTAMIAPGIGEGYFAVLAQTQGASIMGGYTNFPGDMAIYDDAAGSGLLVPEGMNGPFGAIGLAVSASIAAGSTLFDGIIFHCEGMGDVIVSLFEINGDTGEIIAPLDSVVIHQIPEPLTLGLLGLGGLFLRRRK
jgi:hypothetical protein